MSRPRRPKKPDLLPSTSMTLNLLSGQDGVRLRPSTIAVLVMVVAFDRIPEHSALEEVIDCARQYGGVEKATYSTFQPYRTELV